VDTTDPTLTVEQEGEPPEPSPSPAPRRWAIALVALSVVLAGLAVTARYVQLPYDTLAPGSARAVNSVIEVKGHPSYPPQGKLFYTTVSVRERINP
jgi:PDZ domain-containing secreted protein